MDNDDESSSSNNSLYDAAVAALNSSQHQARTREALERTARRRQHTVHDMREYMQRIHLELPLEMDMIHVTGTKGKGSTACFCEAILRERHHCTTGLFTSPHLVDIRERIRINGQPVSKEVFGRAYFRVREKLERYNQEEEEEGPPLLPGYFRMLTLMAIYIFAHYEPTINAIVLEVGMGGRYDATNLLDIMMDADNHEELCQGRNVVCGVTLIDMDHSRVLGTTLEQIAWEKGGIFQVQKVNDNMISERPDDSETVDPHEPNTSYANQQTRMRRFFGAGTNEPSVLSVLAQCAATEGMGQMLHIVHEGQTLPSNCKLGLHGVHQRINAELATALCEALIQNNSMRTTCPYDDEGTPGLYKALARAFWPGRCQTIPLVVQTSSDSSSDGPPIVQVNVRCDGAHTTKSMRACMSWFQSVCHSDDDNIILQRVLIFNCSHERNPVPQLQILQSERRQCDSSSAERSLFDTVYFCRSDSERPSMVVKSTAQGLLKEAGVDVDDDALMKTESGDHDDQKHPPSWQDTLASVWYYLQRSHAPGGSPYSSVAETNVFANLIVADALDRIKKSALRSTREWNAQHDSKDRGGKKLRVEVCVTGSLYIVGSALHALDWSEDTAEGRLRPSSN